MKLNRKNIDLAMARKQISVTQLAKAYGVSRARINVILNQREVTHMVAGRMAAALGCDVLDILEDE